MYEIVAKVQNRVGSWVGSSAVHLRDYNVSNALEFVDKFPQLQHILGRITVCIRRIGQIAKKDAKVEKYMENTFGSVEAARKAILRDFSDT